MEKSTFIFHPMTKKDEIFFNKVSGLQKMIFLPEEFEKILTCYKDYILSTDHHVELFQDNIDYGLLFFDKNVSCRLEMRFLRHIPKKTRAIGKYNV